MNYMNFYHHQTILSGTMIYKRNDTVKPESGLSKETTSNVGEMSPHCSGCMEFQAVGSLC